MFGVWARRIGSIVLDYICLSAMGSIVLETVVVVVRNEELNCRGYGMK